MIPIFNKAALDKQRKQNINQSLNQIAYIQKDCRDYLRLFQADEIPILSTNERRSFQFVTQEKLDADLPLKFKDKRYEILSLNPKGKYVFFPKDPFTIYWNIKNKTLDNLNESCYNSYIDNKLFEAKEQFASIMIFTSKIYFIEMSMFHALETKFKTMYLG